MEKQYMIGNTNPARGIMYSLKLYPLVKITATSSIGNKVRYNGKHSAANPNQNPARKYGSKAVFCRYTSNKRFAPMVKKICAKRKVIL